MKHVLSALFLVVFGLAISASAEDAEIISASAEDAEIISASNEDAEIISALNGDAEIIAPASVEDLQEMSRAELEALERELAASPLETEVLTDNDFIDVDDETLKIWNPISWIKNQYKNKCKCEHNKCNCCFKLSLFKKIACLSAEKIPNEQNVKITFKLDQKTLVQKKFTLRGSTSVCGGVPVPGLTFMKFCFTQRSSVARNGAINSCSSIEFKVGGTTGAILTFKCLELKGGKITVGGHQQVDKAAMFVIKAKNPFKGLFGKK